MESPSSSEALDKLDGFLTSFDVRTRQRGEGYLRNRQVNELHEESDTVVAYVSGSQFDPYTTVLLWEKGEWSSECDCPVGENCKHAYAVGRAWQRRLVARSVKGVASATELMAAAAKPGMKVEAGKQSFRQQWSPVLAERLGRPLNANEGNLLAQLAALFGQLQSGFGVLYPAQLKKHGFEVSAFASPGDWDPAFSGWWPRNQPPADPWALWQYIAYDRERSGKLLPEAFVPMTDTRQVRAAVEHLLLKRELDQWRRALTAAPEVEPTPETDSSGLAEVADLRVALRPEGGAALEIRPRADAPWKRPTQRWLNALASASVESIEKLPANARPLALLLRLNTRYGELSYAHKSVPEPLLASILRHPPAHTAVVLPDGESFRVEEEPLRFFATTRTNDPGRLEIHLTLPDGTALAESLRPFAVAPGPLYLVKNRVWRGPPPLPTRRLPVAALKDPFLATGLRATGLQLPAALEARFKTVRFRAVLRCWLDEDIDDGEHHPLANSNFHASLLAVSDDPPCQRHWSGIDGWQWTADGEPPPQGPDDPHYEFDLTRPNAVGAHFGAFKLNFNSWSESWSRNVTKTFPDDFTAWRSQLPDELTLEVSPSLRGLVEGPVRARLSVSVAPAPSSGQDWFDLSVEFKPDDLTLTPEEIKLLVKARGQWVRLPNRGWRRLAMEDGTTDEERAALARLGLDPSAELAEGGRSTHRFHALQLAEAPLDDVALATALRERAATLRALPPPLLPVGLQADLRPYQKEGYHFLAHLATHGLGGVLADDMGLGKTLQTLAWLLWLHQGGDRPEETSRRESAAPLRALVVCPKSVVSNWGNEAARFSPALSTGRVTAGARIPTDVRILVVNYAQLRLRADELVAIPWDAVVLDEGQNIKNPSSATARAARALKARHRLVLTGTPIENRLLDLWSLLAFAQPGLLGSQAAFQRHFNEKDDPAGARARLAARVRSFLLRRTKGQVAQDLPARTEEELLCELEGDQRALYDAELKRARQMLLEVKSNREFDSQRFNILQSLLRLRQICCDPRLLGAAPVKPQESGAEGLQSDDVAPKKRRGRPAKAKPKTVEAEAVVVDEAQPMGEANESGSETGSSAKLEALLDTLEPLVEEGHRVLVFSQFVTMLEIIRGELERRKIGHLMLTGQTENRQALVDQFQAADGPPVFLLSLKAAGSGLNLTAASYVVLYDPWWNPAVEAQAIDRTHRIGQTSQVIAYRLIAKDTVEEKIRALQREKAAMAAAVVQEESLATVLDLDSLRRILA